MSFTSRPSVKVPEEKRKGISNYADLLSLAREYKLGDNASRDLFHKGSGLIAKVKPILLRNAVVYEQLRISQLHSDSQFRESVLGNGRQDEAEQEIRRRLQLVDGINFPPIG
jgi:hypothetical protein